MNTPHPEHDGATPSHPGHEESSSASGGLHTDKTHPSAGAASPLRRSTTASEKNASQAEDTAMVDEGEVSGDEDAMRTEKLDDLEEGEEISDDKMGDRMDTG